MTDVLRIGFFGGGIEAYTVLQALAVEPEFHIRFVHPRFANGPVATKFAVDHNVEIMPFEKINDPKAVEYVRDSNVDLILSINCKQIFRSELLSVPRLGAVNMHDGLLPRQRGGGGTFIGLINGETLGTTVHFIDNGIDTGDIILQQEIRLPEDAPLAHFQEEVLRIAPDMIKTALRQIRLGCVWRRVQNDQPYYYVPTKAPWDELIDWNMSSSEIVDRVRGRTPGPTNFYIYDDRIFHVLSVKAAPNILRYRNTPGQVIERRKDFGVLVKTGDTAIWITSIKTDVDEIKVPDHPLGAMLNPNLHKEMFELKQRVRMLEGLYSEMKNRYDQEN